MDEDIFYNYRNSIQLNFQYLKNVKYLKWCFGFLMVKNTCVCSMMVKKAVKWNYDEYSLLR